MLASLVAEVGQLALVVEEVALGVTAGEAEGDPVAERLAPLFLDPVSLRPPVRHLPIVPIRGPNRFASSRSAATGTVVRVGADPPDDGRRLHGRT